MKHKSEPQHVTIYKDTKGEYRWRAVASNGKTIADSGEGYKSAANAARAVRRMFARVQDHGFQVVLLVP